MAEILAILAIAAFVLAVAWGSIGYAIIGLFILLAAAAVSGRLRL